MIHLRAIEHKPPRNPIPQFPFNLTAFQNLESLTFESDVTFLVGENGSGKSTLLEALACAAGSITVGSESVLTDRTLESVRQFAKHLKPIWNKKTRRGFFMRSEDFFGFTRKIAEMRDELRQEMEALDQDMKGRSEYARGLARSSFAGQLAALQQSYGEGGLDAQSHGESYFVLFQSRFVPGGLYLLDEPEAPLSPLRQLSLLAMLKQMVDQQAQFIIATHSPIVMAYPGATIFNFNQGQIEQTRYDELEHVTLTRAFLNNPGSYLKHLFE